jgi:hypothetical protein
LYQRLPALTPPLHEKEKAASVLKAALFMLTKRMFKEP